MLDCEGARTGRSRGSIGGACGRSPAGAYRRPPTLRSPRDGYALVVARQSPEKGIDVAIEACRRVGIPLVVAGAGLERRRAMCARRTGVRFVGRVDDARLAALRAGAALALVPSRSAETFGLAAAEAMAAGVPVAGSRVGALPELLEEQAMAPPGDARALAEAIERCARRPRRGGACAGAGPRAVRPRRWWPARLAEIYRGATALHYARS